MLARRWFTPTILALLSLGFLGQSPIREEGTRRHISSCDGTGIPAQSVNLPSNLFSFVQTDGAVQAAQAYQMFLMSMQINALVNPFAAPSVMGFGMAPFPSYAMPMGHYVAPTPVPTAGLAWHGILQDPQLQYLIHPSAPAQASAAGSLDALVSLPSTQANGTLSFSVGNSALSASPAAAAVSPTGAPLSRL